MNRREFLKTGAAAAVAANLPSLITESAAADTDADRKLRVAVIGHTGHGDYGHGLDTMWLGAPETEIVAVADADEKGLAAAQKKLRVAKGFADYRQMLAEIKPDIVAIAPRHVDEHRDMALAAIATGARGIYIEKPLCRTPAEADEIVVAAEKAGVKFAVAHRNRYHPAVAAIDRMLQEDAIGRLLELRARGKEDARGGAQDLWVLGAHVLNLANHFAGKPLACSAVLLQDNRPITKADVREGAEGVGPIAGNTVHARFDTERGAPIYFDSIQNAGAKTAGFGLQLIGANGIIDLRFDGEPLAHILAGSPFKPVKEPRAWVPISSAGAGKPEPIDGLGKQVSSHWLGARDLIAAIRENRQPLCSAADGRVTVEMIAAVFESHRLDGRRVTFPLQTRGNPLALM
jgi:predicted dehydrogenase